MYRLRFLIYFFFGFILITSLALLFAPFSDDESAFNFDQKSIKINPIFSNYDSKVFAAVPSNGYYEVKGVNPATFKTFDGRSDAHIGFDAEHVYAGNIIFKGLKPQTLVALGNNYYSDGSVTYYCSSFTERNESLSAVGFVLQLIGYNFGLSGKPQNYWYPFQELPKGGKYTSAQANGVAVTETQAFYEGLLMPEAEPKTIRSILMPERRGDFRESTDYFTDGKRIYYHEQLLSMPYSPDVYQIDIEGDIPSRNTYLTDQKKGMVYVDGKAFDSSKAPYYLFSQNLQHSNQVLFASNDGVYFYNSKREKVERAGDLPFKERFKEIAPDVFASADQIYYLKDSEQRNRKRGMTGRSTHFLELSNVKVSSLKKISSEALNYGSVWQSGNRYFYFDDLGSSQMMHSAVYEFKNPSTAKQIVASEDLRTDDIRDLQSSGELFEPESNELFEAQTEFPDEDFHYFFWIVGIGFGMVFLVMFLFRNKKIAPFILKDDYLIMNNLTFNKYIISDIDKVVFGTVRSNFRGDGGYSGRVFVLKKNGKTSRNFMFSSKITLFSQSEDEILQYIRELQAELRARGIETEVR